MTYVKLFLTALPIALILDFLWIGVVASGFYRAQLGFIMLPSPNWAAAIAFYVFFVIALIVFVLNPALTAHSLKTALIMGAFLGFAAYMTYDLSNLATLKDWPVLVTVVDILWGTIFSAIVAGSTYLIGTKFLGL